MHFGFRLDIDLPSEDEDEEAVIQRRREARAAMLQRFKIVNDNEDSQPSTSANSPRQREQTPDSDAVADEAVSVIRLLKLLVLTCIYLVQLFTAWDCLLLPALMEFYSMNYPSHYTITIETNHWLFILVTQWFSVEGKRRSGRGTGYVG